jgi:hypothetical protein
MFGATGMPVWNLLDFEELELKENSEYKTSANFIAFAVEQGWYGPESGEPFNVNEIHGSNTGRNQLLGETTGSIGIFIVVQMLPF